MASTEAARVHPLGMQHLAGCLALSRAANWNQNAADWQLMLEVGAGFGLTLADGTLAATTINLPYSERFDKLVDDFNKTQQRPLSPHLVWRLVATLAK